MRLPTLFLSWLLGCGGGAVSAPPAPPEIKPIRALQTISTPTAIDGPTLSAKLAEPSGHLRIFNFWASWCGPCLQEMPTFRSFALRHRDVEVVFVNVDVQAVQPQRVPPLIEDRGLQWMSHLLLQSTNPDRDLRTHVPGWASELPMSIFVDEQGKILESHAVAMSGADLEAALERAKH